jgi:hypothetical protein
VTYIHTHTFAYNIDRHAYFPSFPLCMPSVPAASSASACMKREGELKGDCVQPGELRPEQQKGEE